METNFTIKFMNDLKFNNSLSNIIDHEWFKNKLPNSWESETPIKQCVQHCSSRIKIPDYFREHIPITPI